MVEGQGMKMRVRAREKEKEKVRVRRQNKARRLTLPSLSVSTHDCICTFHESSISTTNPRYTSPFLNSTVHS